MKTEKKDAVENVKKWNQYCKTYYPLQGELNKAVDEDPE